MSSPYLVSLGIAALGTDLTRNEAVETILRSVQEHRIRWPGTFGSLTSDYGVIDVEKPLEHPNRVVRGDWFVKQYRGYA